MAEDEQFSLCWNNFNSNLSAGFHESLCRGDLVDVTLAAEGQLVKAHRLVLSVCSPYFRKMFTQMPPNQHAFVFLKDVSHSALKDLIQFMYCGEVNVKQEALPAFISTAEALQIKGLTDSDSPQVVQPLSEPTTPTPQLHQIQTSPRLRQQRTVAATRAYKIETVDEGSNDSKPQTTQIVIQTSAPSVSQQTAVIPQPVIQQQHHIQTQQQLQSQNHHQINTVGITSGVSNTAISTHVVGSHKRPAQRSSVGSVTHVKRSKTNTIDPLECVETGNGTSTSQQMTIQTAIVSGAKSQQNESDYIDLPLELPTKSEPDYVDETGEVDQNEQDATYVEDEAYGDLRYDDTYFTENEDVVSGTATTTTTAANINVSNTTNANVTGVSGTTASGVVGTATTSKAIAKQQSTSFSDSSYADATDQTNNDAQDVKFWMKMQGNADFTFKSGQRGCTLLNYQGFNYVKNRKSGLKTYWICAKKGSTRCNARLVTDMVDNVTKIVLDSCRHNHEQNVPRRKRKPAALTIVEAMLKSKDTKKLLLAVNKLASNKIACLAMGQRGCTVLLYNNEKFVRNRKSATRTYWICSKKDVTLCRARMVTAQDQFGIERIRQRTFEHNHIRKFPRRTKVLYSRKSRKNVTN